MGGKEWGEQAVREEQLRAGTPKAELPLVKVSAEEVGVKCSSQRSGMERVWITPALTGTEIWGGFLKLHD